MFDKQRKTKVKELEFMGEQQYLPVRHRVPTRGRRVVCCARASPEARSLATAPANHPHAP